jgi:hypothetical protein
LIQVSMVLKKAAENAGNKDGVKLNKLTKAFFTLPLMAKTKVEISTIVPKTVTPSTIEMLPKASDTTPIVNRFSFLGSPSINYTQPIEVFKPIVRGLSF